MYVCMHAIEIMCALIIHCSGIVLKDLVAIDAQAKDYSSGGSEQQLVNMAKYRMLWNQLTVLRRTQLTSPAIQVDLDHMRILRVRVYRGISYI